MEPGAEEGSHRVDWSMGEQSLVPNDPQRSSKKPLTGKFGIRYMVYRMPSSFLQLKSYAKPILRDEVYLPMKEAILTGEMTFAELLRTP